jgi:hypothetical protein
MSIERTSALDGRVYTQMDNGTVLVRDPGTGRTGRFRGNGRWIEGDLKDADPHMIDFVSLLKA